MGFIDKLSDCLRQVRHQVGRTVKDPWQERASRRVASYRLATSGAPSVEKEKELLQAAYRGFPAFQAETLRRLADVEMKLGNAVASAAYRIRLVRRLGFDTTNQLMTAVELLHDAGLLFHARFIAELVVSGQLGSYEAERERAQQFLQSNPLPRTMPVGVETTLDSRRQSSYRVSYIFSLYNEEARVEEAVRAYARQTLYQQGQVEYVLVDSHSPQNERAVMERLVKQFDHLLYVRTDQRELLYQAWNRGIDLATGQYIGFTTPSEFLYDDAMQEMASVLDQSADVDWVQGDFGVPQSSAVTDPDHRLNERLIDCCTNYSPFAELLQEAYLTFTCSMLRRRILDDVGAFDPSLTAASDTEFKMRFVGHGRVHQLGKVLGFAVDDGSPRLTRQPVVEIEHFIAEHRWRNLEHLQRIHQLLNLHRRAGADSPLPVMTGLSLGCRSPWVGISERLFADVGWAQTCTRIATMSDPDRNTHWSDLAVISSWQSLLQAIDHIALGISETPQSAIDRKNRRTLYRMLELSKKLSTSHGHHGVQVLHACRRPLAYGEIIW